MHTKAPVIELFSIGTELVYGRIQDTNAFWMAQQITRLGGRIRRITQLTDDLEDILRGFREAIARQTAWVITSGGLGPTPDDLTHTALAALTGSPLQPREEVIQDYIRRRNLRSREEVSPNLVRMATVPLCAEVMLNPVGWAPATRVEVNGTTFLCLPGPPREMEAVFTAHVLPLLAERCPGSTLTQRVWVNTYESDVAPLLQHLMERHPGAYLKGLIAARSDPGWLPIEVIASGRDPEEARHAMRAILQEFQALLREKGQRLRTEGTLDGPMDAPTASPAHLASH